MRLFSEDTLQNCHKAYIAIISGLYIISTFAFTMPFMIDFVAAVCASLAVFFFHDVTSMRKAARLMTSTEIREFFPSANYLEMFLVLGLILFSKNGVWRIELWAFVLMSIIRFIYLAIKIEDIERSQTKMSSDKFIYLGTSICGGKTVNHNTTSIEQPFFLKDDATRTMHTGLFGATGVGKTSSVLMPLIRHDILTNKHTVVIDPKNDSDLANMIYQACKESNKRMIYINFSRPEISDAYNPLAYGSPNMVKDKLMSSAPWSEQFYKTVATLHTLSSANKITWETIKNRPRAAKKDATLNSLELSESDGVTLEKILPYLKEQPNTEGIVAFIESLMQSEAGYILRENPSCGAKKFWEDESIGAVLFVIPTEKMSELSNHIGKLIYSDYKALSGYIKDLPRNKQRPMSLYIDEASKYIDQDFINYLTMARSSNTRIIIATQGISDFGEFGEAMMSRVMGNIQTKIIMQTTSGKDAEFISRAVGTHEVEVFTEQVDEDGFKTKKTGKGTVRTGKEFRIHTDQLKNLGVGEGIIIQNGNSDIQHVYFDSRYFSPKVTQDIQNERLNDDWFIKRSADIEEYIRKVMVDKFEPRAESTANYTKDNEQQL